MATMIRAGETALAGVRRLTLEQLDSAIERLASAGEVGKAIYDVRKRIKNARAALRLVRDALDNPVYAKTNRLLRDAGRTLAPARDSEVLLRTFDAVAAQAPVAPDGRAVARVRDRLAERRAALPAEAPDTRAADRSLLAEPARSTLANILHRTAPALILCVPAP